MNQVQHWKMLVRRRWARRFLVAAVLLVIAAALLGSLRIRRVEVEGSKRYSAEEMEQFLFPDEWSRNPLVFFFRERTGKSRQIPFVERYTATMTDVRSIHVIVYEKEIIGYVDAMGCYLYFDRDGYVVESSSKQIPNVPQVVGLAVDHMVLYEKLPVEDEGIFQEVLNVTQYLQSNEIEKEGEEVPLVSLADTVRVDETHHITCIFGDISVYLGNEDNMEEKLLEMKSILPQLFGRSGTLYLDTYDENVEKPSYVFK